MTDEEIVKALECWAGGKDCDWCAYGYYALKNEGKTCIDLLAEDALDLIHRLQEENSRLKKELEKYYSVATKCQNEVYLYGVCKLEVENKRLKDELEKAVKETARDIHKLAVSYYGGYAGGQMSMFLR